jgi:hypothetical protein
MLVAVTAMVGKSVASKRGRARRQAATLRCARKDIHKSRGFAEDGLFVHQVTAQADRHYIAALEEG